MRARSLLLPLAFVYVMAAAFACSDDENKAAPNGTDASTSDASSTSDGSSNQDGSTSADSATQDSAAQDATAFTDAGGMQVTEQDGGTFLLTEGAAITAAGNGYKFGAAATDGGVLRSLAIILRHVVNDGGAQAVAPVGGTYHCNATLAPDAGTESFSAVIQYGRPPGPAFFQTDLNGDCTVTLDAFNAVGAKSTGTFTGTIPMVGKPDAGVVINGTFDLVRTN